MMNSRLWKLCLILLIAFGLRVIELERRPLHFDEGNNVYFGLRATHLLADSIEHAEADPPLHRAALGGWMTLVGTSPFAIRFLSVIWGMLAVALVAQLGRAVLRNEGPIAFLVLLMAASAFLIDYAQEAKGYPLVSAAALASTLAWLRMMRHQRAQPLSVLVYALCSMVMLGTHYFAAPLLGMHWVWLLAHRLPVKRWPRFIVAQALACVPVILWIALAWRGIVAGGMRAASTPAGFHPLEVMVRIWGEFAVGRYAIDYLPMMGAIVLSAGWLFGLVVLWRSRQRAVFWLCASVVLAFAFAEVIAPRLSIFYPRFLLWVLPFVFVSVAGLMQLRTVWWANGLAAVIGVTGLISFFNSPIAPQTDYRPLIAQVRPLIRPGDAALGTYIWMDGMFASYAPETMHTLQWTRDFYLNDGSDIEQLMQRAQGPTHRIWHLNFERSPDDPATRSALWLRQHGAEAARWVQGNLTAVLFDTTPASADICCAKVMFADQLGVTWQPISATAHAGDIVRVDLRWRALRVPDALGISLQVLSPEGVLVVQRDQDAVNGLVPTITWQPDQVIDDARAVLLPPDLLAGKYALRLVVYRRDTGQRLVLPSGADGADIGVVTISPHDSPAPH